MATWAERARLAASSSTPVTNGASEHAAGSSVTGEPSRRARESSSLSSRAASAASTSSNWRASTQPSSSSLSAAPVAESSQAPDAAPEHDEGDGGQWQQTHTRHRNDNKGKRLQSQHAHANSTKSSQPAHKSSSANGGARQRQRPAADVPAAQVTTNTDSAHSAPRALKSNSRPNGTNDNTRNGDSHAADIDQPGNGDRIPLEALKEDATQDDADTSTSKDSTAPTSSQKQPPKQPAPEPKVNVWAIRTQQLKSAASSSPASEQVTPAQSQSASPVSSPARMAASAGGAADALPAETWPAPNEDVSASASPVQDKSACRRVSDSSEAGKRKGDKTKWIPIQADIVFTNFPTGQRTGSGSKGATGNANASSNGASHKARKQPSAKASPSVPLGPSSSSSSNKSAAKNGQQQPRASSATAAEQAKAVSAGRSAAQTAAGPTDKPREEPPSSAPTETPKGASESSSPRPETSAEHQVAKSTDTVAAAQIKDAPAASTPQQPTKPAAPNGVGHHHGQPAFRGGRGQPQRGAFRGGRGGAGHRNNAAVNGQHYARAQLNTHNGVGENNSSAHQPQQQQQASTRPSENVEGSPAAAAALYGPADYNKSAYMAGPVLDPRTLDPTRYWLLGQLEWWFSVDNLCRDMYLRSKMDAEGWIEIGIIAAFNRIQNLTTDVAVVHETMTLTPLLEVVDGFVRLRQHWPEWVLPSAAPSRVSEQRLAAARAHDIHHFYMQQQQQYYLAAMQEQQMQMQTIPQPPASSSNRPLDGMVKSSAAAAAAAAATSSSTSHARRTRVDSERGGSSEDDDEGEGTAATTVSTGSQVGEDDGPLPAKDVLLAESIDAALAA
ncbi:hypothetical protein ACM66B_004314 [Microbotryomycetes sp. NB124-2]